MPLRRVSFPKSECTDGGLIPSLKFMAFPAKFIICERHSLSMARNVRVFNLILGSVSTRVLLVLVQRVFCRAGRLREFVLLTSFNLLGTGLYHFSPRRFEIQSMDNEIIHTGAVDAFVCVISGTVGGLIIGLITEYFTSHSYSPVREVIQLRLAAVPSFVY